MNLKKKCRGETRNKGAYCVISLTRNSRKKESNL